MITFITTPPHAYTHSLFVEHFGDRVNQPVHVAAGIPKQITDLSQSTVIWCDLERYRDDAVGELEAAQASVGAGIARRSLNAAGRAGRRHEVAATLFASGVNSHRTLSTREFEDLAADNAVRYPVFIRRMFEHDGAQSGLLTSYAEVQHALESLALAQDDIAVVEFEDTRCSDGWFRKYGAFYVAGEVIPRHLFVSRCWLNKGADADQRFSAEELEYVNGNAHSRAIASVFQTCGLEYGRIDYATKDDKLVVFEINTNPTVIDIGDMNNRARLEATNAFVRRFAMSLDAL